MIMTKVATSQPALTEAEIEKRVSSAGAASALAGHFIGEEDRETLREILRGDLSIEDAIESVRKSVHSAG